MALWSLIVFPLLTSWESTAQAASIEQVKKATQAEAAILPTTVQIEMPIYSPVLHRNVIVQAEALVRNRIRQILRQEQSVAQVRVYVLGNYHGNIIPVLTTTVSRTQWQSSPDVRRWTDYNDSYALFQRPSPSRTVVARRAEPISRRTAASRPSGRARPPERASSSKEKPESDRLTEQESLFDRGGLAGAQVQQSLAN